MTGDILDCTKLEVDGFAFVRGMFDEQTVAALVEVLEASVVTEEGRGGVRNLLDVSPFRDLAESPSVMVLVTMVLGANAFAVRGILFDKTDAANWKAPWHQDVTIAVTERVDVAGYGPWSAKSGVVCVQPPAHVLERMVSVRIHLDDCPAENGALRVLQGTHLAGKLSQNDVDAHVRGVVPVVCDAGAGDALIMKPLLLHASSSASLPRHRRILHFDYADVELDGGLQWREQPMVARPTRRRT